MRAEKSRNASRLYRQRKKAFVEQLKMKLEELTNEKNHLLQDYQRQQELLNKLTAENTALKRSRITSSSRLETKRQAILSRIESSLVQNDTSQLGQLMEAFDSICGQISQLGTSHLQDLISPTTVSQLVSSGFFKNAYRSELESSHGGIAEVAKKIITYAPNLTPEERSRIEEVVRAHYASLQDILNERKGINGELEASFQEKVMKTQGAPNVQNIISMTASLDLLRKNLEAEAMAWEKTIHSLLGVLTVEQRAHFILKSEYRHASVQQLKYLWAALYGNSNIQLRV